MVICSAAWQAVKQASKQGRQAFSVVCKRVKFAEADFLLLLLLAEARGVAVETRQWACTQSHNNANC